MKTKTEKSRDKQLVDAFYRVYRFLSEVTDLHKLLDLVMDESKQVVDAEASSLLLYDKDTNELYFEVAHGPKAKEIKEVRVPLEEGIAGASAREKRTILVKDCSKDPRHFKEADRISRFVTRNLIATPMIRQGRLIGVLEVLNKKSSSEKTFDNQDIRVLEFFAAQAAIAIENAQLVSANITAERMAALGQAIAGISHYVKNILTSATGATSLMDMGLDNHDMELINKSWPILKRNNKTIWDLVQDMLSYSKERKPELTNGEINLVLKEIIENCQETAKANQIDLVLELDPKLLKSRFDGIRIRDAMLNLVNNAMDACMDKKGANVRLVSLFHKSNKKIEIRIGDNGSGIPEDIQKKIFEPFFSTKGKRGTGLGLAITRKIIEEHEGSIQVQSTIGVGTTFIIILPFLKSTIRSKKQNQ